MININEKRHACIHPDHDPKKTRKVFGAFCLVKEDHEWDGHCLECVAQAAAQAANVLNSLSVVAESARVDDGTVKKISAVPLVHDSSGGVSEISSDVDTDECMSVASNEVIHVFCVQYFIVDEECNGFNIYF